MIPALTVIGRLALQAPTRFAPCLGPMSKYLGHAVLTHPNDSALERHDSNKEVIIADELAQELMKDMEISPPPKIDVTASLPEVGSPSYQRMMDEMFEDLQEAIKRSSS